MNLSDLVGARKKAVEVQARMRAEARSIVLRDGCFLPTAQLSQIVGCSRAQLDDWQREGKIFSIKNDGEVYWPIYAFAQGEAQPGQAMETVLKIFGNTRSGWNLAFWFAAGNSYLDDVRPQDVLNVDPLSVVDATKEEIEGIQHG